MITFDDFSKLELKVGKVLEAIIHPDADKLYLLKVDIGERIISLVAGIKDFYASEDLVGKLITVLVNLEPKKIRGFLSEGMVLAAQGQEGVSLIVSDRAVAPGSPIK